MSTIIAGVTLCLVFGLGVVNLLLLPQSFRAGRSWLARGGLAICCLAALVLAYFLGRSGYVADAQQIGGDQVAPFYGTEWYVLIVIGIISLGYQLYLIHRSTQPTA